MAEEPMNLDQALRASYEDALTLGVNGIDADALARRAEAARAVLAEQSRRVDAAYRGAAGGAEPDVRAPFGTTLVLQHGGDLNAVLGDPMFALTLQQQMGLGYQTEYVHEDDDPRWESVAPTAEDDGRSVAEATRVRAALVDLGAVDPTTLDAVGPAPVRVERQQVESPTLQTRMEQAYLDGYDERIRTGLAYAAATDDAERSQIGGDVAAEKVGSYAVLEQTRRTLDEELPPMLTYSDEEAAAPLSAAAEGALVDAAHEAGRWSALDAGADDLLNRIDNRLAEHEGAPSVYAGDERDAWFRYLDPDVQTARQALPQLERDNTVRAARALTEAQPRQGRGALFERLRERRDERRAQTASLTDPGRQTTTPQQAQSIK